MSASCLLLGKSALKKQRIIREKKMRDWWTNILSRIGCISRCCSAWWSNELCTTAQKMNEYGERGSPFQISRVLKKIIETEKETEVIYAIIKEIHISLNPLAS